MAGEALVEVKVAGVVETVAVLPGCDRAKGLVGDLIGDGLGLAVVGGADTADVA